MSIIKEVTTTTTIHPDGQEETTITEKTANFQRCEEPDYIKLYTQMWCEFNNIPFTYRALFFELVTRMTYCRATDLEHSQLVNTGKPWANSIMQALGWKKAMYQRGLKALCDCGAIKQVGRGVYQINPMYAGKGEWKYNPKLDRGGVEDLVATFRFKEGTVDAKIVWADNGEDNDLNAMYRDGLGVTASDGTILKTRRVQAQQDEADLPGQLSFADICPEEMHPAP